MRRIPLTGMSGTGKSTLVRELVARGYQAVDTDDGWCDLLPDGLQRWREDAVEALLDTRAPLPAVVATVLRVSGVDPWSPGDGRPSSTSRP